MKDIFHTNQDREKVLRNIKRALSIKDEKVIQFYDGAEENN